MIDALQPLPVGNAVKLWLSAPSGSHKLRVLRKQTDNISGPTDAQAVVVYEGDDTFVVDFISLKNGTEYYYRSFWFDGEAWTLDDETSSTATPNAINSDPGPDVLSVVRDRLKAGLAADVAANILSGATGAYQVYTAPPEFDSVTFPVATVHLRSEVPLVRSIGEIIAPDSYDLDTGLWADSEGWLARVNLDIIGWVMGNPDERIALRKSMRKVLIGNLPIFDSLGMEQVEFTFTDTEDFESYGSPVYQTVCSFTCLAPALALAQPPVTLIPEPVASATLINT